MSILDNRSYYAFPINCLFCYIHISINIDLEVAPQVLFESIHTHSYRKVYVNDNASITVYINIDKYRL